MSNKPYTVTRKRAYWVLETLYVDASSEQEAKDLFPELFDGGFSDDCDIEIIEVVPEGSCKPIEAQQVQSYLH